MADAPTSDDEPARLYGLPLDEFVAERDKAARAAREAGRKDEAKAIAGLRKPTLAAWAVNQLARQERREVDLLLDSGKRLVDAQRAALEGSDRSALDRARASFDQAVGTLVDRARAILGDRASEGALVRIESTLRTAAVEPEGRELLASGTLVKELEGTGWDLLAGLGAGLPGPERSSERRKAAARRPADERRRLREELQAARKRRDEAAARLRDAERDEARAAEALAEARERREEAERDLDRTEDEVARAQDALDAG
jgi:hypothetical protein